MTFATFYLVCFVVGVAMSLLSFVFSGLHIHTPLKWHSIGSHHGAGHGGHGFRGMSWLNPPMMFAFLAWFGGSGYVLTTYHPVWFVLALGAAIFAGCVGAAILSWFLVKVLLPHEAVLNDSDYRLVGTVATVNQSIREGGTGEIVFTQGGVRSCAGARREDGKALEKGREVVIARVEKGIAYVAPWEEWTK
jgi:membrane protein implicated in regulation of membrane protease activity